MLSPKTLALTAVMTLVVLGGANRAQAQTLVTATVPFEFSLSGQAYPAGTYTLASKASDRSLLVVQNWSANVSGVIAVQPDYQASGSQTVLKFNRYGNRYFLSSIVIAGDDVTLAMRRSRAERETASLTDRPEVVAIVASNR